MLYMMCEFFSIEKILSNDKSKIPETFRKPMLSFFLPYAEIQKTAEDWADIFIWTVKKNIPHEQQEEMRKFLPDLVDMLITGHEGSEKINAILKQKGVIQ